MMINSTNISGYAQPALVHETIGVPGADVSRSAQSDAKSLGVLVQGSVDRATIGERVEKPSTYDALGDMAKQQKSDDKVLEAQEKADEEKIQELKERDQEVRIHEQAHAAVGGQYAGAPSYDFETGPDGNRYAVGGEVSIDVSEEKDPQDTVSKMQVVRAAALAPAEPSAQDYKVAAEASQKEQAARAQVAKQSVANDESNSSLSTHTAAKEPAQGLAHQALQLYKSGDTPVAKAFSAQA
ncbi:putative metalloprotease CJM1_0395 family protein [Glaciecola sp. SC05]|uniref:putative metalloprotease CJM1_0395 family protein n=1 Tax=Glaciecola sp. SC05 TaxID=1987355 RepID=UPI003529B25E